MSQKTYTLRVGDRKVRTTANKRWHIAVPAREEGKLKVTKRTDSSTAVTAEIRRLTREGAVTIRVFDRGQLLEGVGS